LCHNAYLRRVKSPSPSRTTKTRSGTRMQLAQIALTVADIERAVAFYGEAVGLPLMFRAPPSLAFFGLDGARLMLSTPEGEFRPGGSTVLYLRVPDIQARHAELKARGVPFVDEPHLVARMPDHDLWMTFFRDPDGHTLALMAEVRPPAA
jgi:methylmalonyl-CoA/ethylmalonyl-CoA epimerase